MADFPALPLWTDAYLSDLHPRLTLEQHGCMILLMQFAWRTPSCSLPDDDGLMARMLGITEHRWKQKLKPVIGSLWTVANGQWTNKRLTKERKYVEQNVEQRRAAGRASALKRKETVPTAVQLPTPTPTEEEDSVSNETEGAREIQPKVKNGVRGIRLPLDWQPSADDRRFAAGLGLAPDKTGDIFRDYWLAQPGTRGTKLDWPATWRNWCRREADSNPRPNGGGHYQPRPGGVSSFAIATRLANEG